MTLWKLIIRSFIFYRRKNLAVILGIAVSATVITGSLIVGHSIQYNLNRIADLRLGNVSHAVTTGERFVTADLALKLQDALDPDARVAPVLVAAGIAVSGGGEVRVNNVQVLGTGNAFDELMGLGSFYGDLQPEEAIISKNLAGRLSLDEGDEFLLRIRKASLIPLNAPFVADEEPVVSSRFTVKAIAGEAEAGGFNLKISQTAPYNVFVSAESLNRLLELDNKSNLLLISGNSLAGNPHAGNSHAGNSFAGNPLVGSPLAGNPLATDTIYAAIHRSWSLSDAGLHIRELSESNEYEVLSERVFLDMPVIDALTALPHPAEFILSYFVNSITNSSSTQRGNSSHRPVLSTPYSFVSTLTDSLVAGNEIVVNSWLAADLNIFPGDTLLLNYYRVGPLRRLTEAEEAFIVKEIVPMEGRFADNSLMPEIPGLSDAGNCRDWETGIPIDLEKIRDRDERYWTDYRGLPKAFISVGTASRLWENMYGSYTSVRFPSDRIERETLTAHLTTHIDPLLYGFGVTDVKSESRAAAGGGVDFTQLFFALSFFVLLSGIILSVLLLLLNLEGRQGQLHTLSALGIPRKTINRLMFSEGFILSVTGALLGSALAILYTGLVIKALNGVWADIVRTDMLKMHVTFPILLTGFVISLLTSWITISFAVHRFFKPKKPGEALQEERRLSAAVKYGAIISGATALLLITSQILRSQAVNPAIFFVAGGLMLVSLLLWFYHIMNHAASRPMAGMNILSLSIRNGLRNKSRSISIVTLLGIGTFLVLATGANRKDLFVDAGEKSSGTGGLLFFAESTIPVSRDLNDGGVRDEYGLADNFRIIQFSRLPGDEASCLNLNKISNPLILGVDPDELEGRFSFATGTPWLDRDFPWSSLRERLPGGLVPAIADQTVIRWSLGMTVGDTLLYSDEAGNTLKLLLIGGLANSVFQGNVIIADSYFQKHFPGHIGSGLFLIDAGPQEEAELSSRLNHVFRDHGWEMTLSALRLAEFNSVENTYLSIFLLMGVLAIFIGTAGLSVVLARSILERKNEIALLKAVGISRRKILKMFMNEYVLLLLAGIVSGLVSAALATLPSLISPNTDISLLSVLSIAALLFMNGVVWIFLMMQIYLKEKDIATALRNE